LSEKKKIRNKMKTQAFAVPQLQRGGRQQEMSIIEEILRRSGNIEYLRERESLCLENGTATLFLEHLGFGPAGGLVLRLVYIAKHEEVEMHFEKHSLCWLPYYLRDSKTEKEIFLYEFVGVRQPLHMDMGAGSYLIQRACFLELVLRSQGFDRLDHESLYHPLFARSAS
jgi:hypothetical protein